MFVIFKENWKRHRESVIIAEGQHRLLVLLIIKLNDFSFLKYKCQLMHIKETGDYSDYTIVWSLTSGTDTEK